MSAAVTWLRRGSFTASYRTQFDRVIRAESYSSLRARLQKKAADAADAERWLESSARQSPSSLEVTGELVAPAWLGNGVAFWEGTCDPATTGHRTDRGGKKNNYRSPCSHASLLWERT